ncbi:polymorphic toxin type 44 domain-containing protein [Saccharopolyspora hirsuta]|uniref:Bacterial toxin 44 domain-containing protein n=1 Tax=Saccharopolyspora hirsuta TaxID=1837 RepID=A0A5M7BJV5_SACHI|nr:polymorphic toxin type 44 domain-containing protein [Saccharopolyspora hirsuta]KAA5829120.1 hypothetical protein F1721_25960 [Saccharopolyspora hirsuta]
MADKLPEGPPPGPGKGRPDPEVGRVIYAVGDHLEVSDKVMLAAFEAALVESGMENLNYGDRDSVGVFQQRPSQGWGSAKDCMNVNYASRQFFSRAAEAEADNPKYSAGELAQAVQRSAFPDRYDEVEDRARDLLGNAEESWKDQAAGPRAGGRGRKEPDWAEISEGRFKRTLEYIHGEMVQNQNSPIAWVIWALNEPWIPDPDIGDIASKLFGGAEWTKWLQLMEDFAEHPTAMLLFAVKVAPGMDWDHKPKIRAREGLDEGNPDQLYFKIPGDDAGREVFYDVWSNIHYGYVGRACGFDEDVLHTAPRLPGTGEHDKGDVFSMQAGMDLWNEHEEDLTLSQLRAKAYEMINQIDQHTPNLTQVRKWSAP